MPKIADRVKETTTSTGVGTINLDGAVAGYRAFLSAFVTTDVVYYAIEDGTNWEVGYGTLTTGSPWTLSRTLISSSTGSLISWGAGTKNVFCTAPASESFFPSGTVMLFAQTSAPTGWTKSVTHNNKALRIVSGTAGSGGTSAFTTVFASRTPAGSVSTSGSYSGSTGYTSVGSTDAVTQGGSVSISGSISEHTLTTAQIPGHTHGYTVTNSTTGSGYIRQGDATGGTNSVSFATQSTGGGGSHSHSHTIAASFTGNSHSHTPSNANHYHTESGSISASSSFTGTAMDFAVQYVDVIAATKD